MDSTHEDHGGPHDGHHGHLSHVSAEGSQFPEERPDAPVIMDNMSRTDVPAPPSPTVEEFQDVKETFRARSPEYTEEPRARFNYAHWLERAIFLVFIGVLVGFIAQLLGKINTLAADLDEARHGLHSTRGELDDALWKLESMQNITRAFKVIGCE